MDPFPLLSYNLRLYNSSLSLPSLSLSYVLNANCRYIALSQRTLNFLFLPDCYVVRRAKVWFLFSGLMRSNLVDNASATGEDMTSGNYFSLKLFQSCKINERRSRWLAQTLFFFLFFLQGRGNDTHGEKTAAPSGLWFYNSTRTKMATRCKHNNQDGKGIWDSRCQFFFSIVETGRKKKGSLSFVSFMWPPPCTWLCEGRLRKE